ncbi:MAG TPA: hypothetical protein VLM37_10860, partial [Fibrobacteraceae bacterium]|nr:hypothetical protein [Fibrobacteraceae bacterium]
HPINPLSSFAKQLREAHHEGQLEGRNEGIEQGIEQGAEAKQIEMIQSMESQEFDWTQIERITGLDKTGYEAIKKKHAERYSQVNA